MAAALKERKIKDFSKYPPLIDVPDLLEMQRASYEEFLQKDIPPEKRENKGLEAIFREVFPVESFNGKMSLEYVQYRFIEEQEVYLGDIPLMNERGSFIINGTERIVVNQIQRTPGVFFEEGVAGSTEGRVSYRARIIPERGNWID